MLWLIHVTSTEIHVVLKKNALFRWLFFGMVNSYISANVNTVYPQQRKRVSLYVEPDTHLFARLRRKRKLFHSSGLTLSVSGHVLQLNHVHERMTQRRAATDTGGCLRPAKHTKRGGATDTPRPRKTERLNDVASRTVQLQPECLWLEIRYAPEAIQLVSMTQSVKESYRKPCLIYCCFKFTFYHCVSWLHQSREGSFVPFVFFLLF